MSKRAVKSSFIERMKDKVKKMKEDLVALYYAYRNPETPFIAKLLIGITIGYLLSPIDLIPDFIPVLGLVDDLLIVPLLIVMSIRLIPPKVWEISLERAAKEPIVLEKSKKPIQISFFHFLIYWNNSPQGYRKLVIGLLLFTLFNSSDVFLLLKLKEMV